MKIKFIILVGIISTITACSSNSSGSKSGQYTMSDAELAKNDIKCERVAVLGSKIPKKVCKTKVQRQYEQEQSQAAIRKMQSTGGRANESQ